MKKIVLVVVVAIGAWGYVQNWENSVAGNSLSTPGTYTSPQSAYNNRQSDTQVQGEGTVTKILRDDLKGSRHQRFILKLNTGLKILIAHNIDLAPRIDQLKKGDTVAFFGEYEWNSKGGVIHWTHHDPSGRHVGGWLKHDGNTYQ
jgi:hypothetical protein